MKTKTLVRTLTTALITFGSLAGVAHADIIASFEEIGGNVVLSASGEVDLTGLGIRDSGDGGFGAYLGLEGAYGSYETPWIRYNGGSTDISGVWPGTGFIEGSGDALGIGGGVCLPFYYISNADINSHFSGFSIPNNTFASLGLNEGAYASYSWDAGASGIQSVTISVGTIPEPSSLALLGIGAIALLGRSVAQMRRRR